MFTVQSRQQRQNSFAPQGRREWVGAAKQASHGSRDLLLQRALGNDYLTAANRATEHANEMSIEPALLPPVFTASTQTPHQEGILRRQEASTPSCPDSNRPDFCKPFGSRAEARSCREYLLRGFIPLDCDVFGDEVASLWQA